MGMDVIGKNPTSEVGSYFRNTDTWWPLLAEYVCKIAPEVASNCIYWQSNDGDGLSEDDSRMLAKILQNEIDSGRTEIYAQRRQWELEMMPNERCKLCDGTGTRSPSPDHATGEPYKHGIVCNRCHGEGYLQPWATEYVFCVQNVQRFANFLRTCGGFEIW